MVTKLLILLLAILLIIGCLLLFSECNPLINFFGLLIMFTCTAGITHINLLTEENKKIENNHISKELIETIEDCSKKDRGYIIDTLINASKIELDQIDAIRMCDPSISVRQAEAILIEVEEKEIKENK